MDEGPLKLAQAKRRLDLEAELRDLSNQAVTELSINSVCPAHLLQVAALGRSLAHERGRSLAEGGALRALEIAVGGAKARVGGAFRARDRAWERLRQQQVDGASDGGVACEWIGDKGAWPNVTPPTQEAGRGLWAELEAARAAREGAELRAQEAESQCREKEAELKRLRQAVAAAHHARQKAEQDRDDISTHLPPPPPPTPYGCRGDQDPAGLQAALVELREHNWELRQRLQQRHEEAQELQRALMAAKARTRAAAEARAQLEREQRGLQGRLQHPWVPPHPTEATLRARCLHLQEMLQQEAGARAALGRAARAAGRQLRGLQAELEEQRLRGERYRLQAEATEAAHRALQDQLAVVTSGTSRAHAQGQILRRALEDIGDGTAATACHVAALRVRLRWDLWDLIMAPYSSLGHPKALHSPY
ncbi:myosin-11-like [Phasianus colchicus]|uniref:myosin-11-like n=1 Tax=Phasianus colchicus TaxID=9054 RepID=UPI00129E21C3|nr:myosin-11-like [Phasianus colchicus]